MPKQARYTKMIRASSFTAFLFVLWFFVTFSLQTLVTSKFTFAIDYYVYWNAAKGMFLENISPYSREITLRNQLGIIGREAAADENQRMFMNPPYSLFSLIPAIWMNYSWALAYWISLNLVLLLVVSRWFFPRLPLWISLTTPLFYPAARGFTMGQFSLLISILLLFVHSILTDPEKNQTRLPYLAGVMLAWTTIKPQLTWLLIVFFLLYALKHRLWKAWQGFILGLIGFGLVSLIWAPTWLLEWFRQGTSHAATLAAEPWLIQVFRLISSSTWMVIVGIVATASILLATIAAFVAWWRGKLETSLLLAAVVIATQAVNTLSHTPEQIIFILPIFALLQRGNSRNQYLSWFAFLLIPYLGFWLTFIGYEAFEASIFLPALFISWIILFKGKITEQPISSPAG